MSQTNNAFDIKSTNIDTLALCLRTHHLDDILHMIDTRLAHYRDSEQKEAFVLDLSLLDIPPSGLDLHPILLRLQHYGIQTIALRHPDPDYIRLADQYNLAWLPLPVPYRPLPLSDTAPPPAITETDAPPITNALIVDRPVRAGQQIYARGCDLIALAMVSAGAEVIADGNIHIYAPLRGKALAGAHGNTASRIFTRCMEAELVSIAGVYRTVEQALPESIWNKPTQIYLENERIVMAALSE